MSSLVIVESPAKAKTIKQYLGRGYQVLASYGHVRDLIPKTGAVEPDNDFLMHYDALEQSAKHVDAIEKALKKADTLLLATDPDREGEAIAWHVLELLKSRDALKDKTVKRVVFHQITKAAIKEAADNPRNLAMDLVDAQQARRALDYLVGFNLSPLLWKKVRRGLSAGRVQSPALRMIAERELEIEAFNPQEHWSIEADLNHKKQDFMAKLSQYGKDKVEQFTFTDSKQATKAQKALIKAADGKLVVVDVAKKTRKRNPAGPFTTSTLQQEAARKIGFTASRTMRTAQQLYEGINMGKDEGQVGLISYMRTDSVSLADEAVTEIREFIEQQYGKENVPDAPRTYKTKSKNAQEAHEAIRPTSVMRTPDQLKGALSTDQYKLYRLIWQRTVACQMIHATLDTVGIDLDCGGKGMFRATGSTIRDPGFMQVYLEGRDDQKKPDDDKETMLPALAVGDKIKLKEIRAEQHFTEPPPRYSEASLVKALEEHGIGRPSTYASIISTLQNREYVILDSKRFKPTDVGRIVNTFLTKYFTQYVDYDFTAKLEDELDDVARGDKAWKPLLKDFWQPFIKLVDTTEKNVQRSDVTQEKIDEDCPECKSPLSIRLGRRGRFIGCTNYPECKYTRNLPGEDGEEGESTQPEIVEGRQCPKCDSDLLTRVGRYGKFIGCSNYPKCKFIESLEKPEDTGITCPTCNEGTFVKRRSRRGSFFYACNKFPDCKYAVWNEPKAKKCPSCKWPILVEKVTKRRGTELLCPQESCDYAKTIKEPKK